jgi:Protein of unknown function (DUF3500)/Secretion system C-terminal sorting domain
MKYLLLGVFASIFSYFSFLQKNQEEKVMFNPPPTACETLTGFDKVVCLADAFKATLSASQLATVQLSYSLTDAKKWSNLPQSLSKNRVGIQFGTLNATQLAAAKELLKAMTGTAANEGYAELTALLAADDYLNTAGGGSGYGAGNYYMAFLGTPSKTGLFEIQFGGHHHTVSNTYFDGKIIGATPAFRSAEPSSTFTQAGVTYQPILQEKAAFAAIIASFSTAQAATAKSSSTFNDIVLGPGKDNQFPTTKLGVKVSTLSAAQKTLILNAIKTYTNDLNAEDEAVILGRYQAELDDTYVVYAGSGDMYTKGDYIRIDGPSVWIEYNSQGGIIIKNENHPHSVWRDRKGDYDTGKAFVGTANANSFKGEFSVYPNPTTNDLNVKIGLDNSAQVTVNVIDMTGRTVLTTRQNLSAGQQNISLDMAKLASGVYACTIEVKTTNGVTLATKKVTKM